MKHFNFRLIIVFVLTVCVMVSCKNLTDERAVARKIVKEWIGKSIIISETIPLTMNGVDTIVQGLHNTPYRILLYVDSSGCTSCKLKLYEWKTLIAEADTLFSGKLSFMFFFQPGNKNELIRLLRREKFSYPVFIDRSNQLQADNNLPDKQAYQCYLIDGRNKILSIGNPTLNPDVWKLYKEIISGQRNSTAQQTSVVIENSLFALNEVEKDRAHPVEFELTNTGNIPLVITSVTADCGCTNTYWDKEPVRPGSSTSIKADISLSSKGFFNKSIQVYCNVPESPIILTIQGTIQ